MGVGRIIFALSLTFLTALSYNSHSGEYTVINRGLEPLKFENEFLKYEGEMTRVDRYTRLLSGKCTTLQNLGPVGIHVKFLKEPRFGQPYPAAPELTLSNVCDAGFDENAFLEKFTRVKHPKKTSINVKDCTVDLDDFQLSNWTIEPHIKKGLGKHFFYGDFIFNVTIFGKPDGENELAYANFNLSLSIVNKELEDHKRANRGKNKGNKKGDNGKEDPKNPETWKDPDKYQNPDNYDPSKFEFD